MQNNSQKRKARDQGPQQKKRSKGNNGRPNPPRRNPEPKQAAAASAYATAAVGKSPSVKQSDRCVVVSHREFIANIVGTVNFGVIAANQFPLNPGMGATFPWLSQIAQNYETYRFRKLKFEFKTRTGTNVPGSVLMAIDPDASDVIPATEQVMSTYNRMVEDAPWKDITLVADPKALQGLSERKFVRVTALAANQDIKLYDSGNMFVGTVDGTAVAWGKLWVEYEVEFHTPQLLPTGSVQSGMITNAAGTGCSTSVPLGTAAVVTGTLISAIGANSIVSLHNLIVGAEYAVAWQCTGNSTSAFASLTGLTLKTAGVTASGAILSTYTATANVGTIQPACTAITGANNMFVITQVPVSAL